MKKYNTCVDVQEEACASLVNLSVDNDANKLIIENSGGINLILSALRNYSKMERVQEEGCRALWTLSYKNNASKSAVAKAGGIEVFENAISNHPHNEQIQKYARYAKKGIKKKNSISQKNDSARFSLTKEVEAYFELEATLFCVVCRENKKDSLLLPCRHLCLCSNCVKSYSFPDCPVCRQKVQKIIEVYL